MIKYQNVRIKLMSLFFMFFFIITGAYILMDIELIKTISFIHYKTSYFYGLTILYIGIMGILSYMLMSSGASRILFFFAVTVAFNIFDIFLKNGFFSVDQFYLFGYLGPIFSAIATIIICSGCSFIELCRTQKKNQYLALTSIVQIIPLILVLVLYLLKLSKNVETIPRVSDSTAESTHLLMLFLFLFSGIALYIVLMIPIIGKRRNGGTSLVHNNLSMSRENILKIIKFTLSSLALLLFCFILYITAKLSLLGNIVLLMSFLSLTILFFLKRQFVTIFSRIVGRLFVVISLIFLCYLYFDNFFQETIDISFTYYRALCLFYLVVVMIINLFQLSIRKNSTSALKEHPKISRLM